MRGTARSLTFRTLLATYPATAALKQGRLRSDLVEFEFAGVRLANTAFKALVRDHAFDVGELALVTYLQAHVYGTPYVLLPAVIVGRDQHQAILYNPARGVVAPGDLEGRRVGVRTYAQTTGVWLRGMLEEEHGVDFTRVHWVTFEESHLAQYVDPPWVVRARPEQQLLPMLMDGEIDAAIFGNELPDGPVRPLIPGAAAAARAWATRHQAQPINHMIVVRRSIARRHPEAVREVYRLLLESRASIAGEPRAGEVRFGVEANRRSLELIIDYALRQQLIPRRVSVDELFDEATAVLGAS